MRAFLLLFAAVLLIGPSQAQVCSQDDIAPQTIAWPEKDSTSPVWELTFLPPSSSVGTVGSGLEIRDVRYNGRMVLKQGHVPILNVKYETGCDCFRDWSYEDQRFVAGNPVGTCYAEAEPGTVETMCEAVPGNCEDRNNDGKVDRCSDIGSFSGVAVERYEDRLVLSSQYSAGWYRYTMRWTLFADGTIHPRFGFATEGSGCTQNPRRHHAYWRFDFDIEDADHDYVVEQAGDVVTETFASEARRTWGTPDDEITWSILDLASGRGFNVAPGETDYLTPVNPNTGIEAVDTFAREDAVVARYKNGEFDDGISNDVRRTPDCDAEFEGEGNATKAIVNGEDTYNTDIVFWYRSGSTKAAIDPGTCYVVGPVLTPVGDWSAPAVATEDPAVPAGVILGEPYPNPFDGSTTIRFSLGVSQQVELTLYDSLGRAVRTVYAGAPPAGAEQVVTIPALGLPSGTYTLRLDGDGIAASKRVVLVK